MNPSVTHPAPHRHLHLRAKNPAGFTLTEVLIALGILAVGITSVASLFPPAILLQKQTVRDILGQQNVRSSEALMRAKTIDAGMLFSFTDNYAADSGPTGGEQIGAFEVRNLVGTPLQDVRNNPYFVPNAQLDVFALSEVDEYIPPQPPGGGPPYNSEFPDMRLSQGYVGEPSGPGDANYAAQQSALASLGIVDRSFPSYIARPQDRELFTVPFIRRGIEATPFINDWTAYAMILARNPEVDEELATAGPPLIPYPSVPANIFPTAGDSFEAIVCANPFDNNEFVPKVFRLPAVNNAFDNTIPDNTIRLLINNATGDDRYGLLIQPGDLLLGDDGVIYRVVGYPDASNLNEFTVTAEGRQAADDIGNAFGGSSKPLRAVWFALRPRGDAPSPLRDIRILSSDTVRLNF
ncbi:MAG: prepilin-type N-terminal cleavage/methylation domain-containing protein [Planctomycetota bacterium]